MISVCKRWKQVMKNSILTGLLLGGLDSSGEVPGSTFTQTLTIERQAHTAAPQILPVYDGKEWAFTARWDDNNQNNLNMQQAMADLGLKGTFYLNTSRSDNDGAEFAQALSEKGCSVGGHTHSHYWLPTLNLNRLFYEILWNRIERETDTDRPVTSFAFPYGRYKSSSDPNAQKFITDAWLRSGYHHCVYSGFVRENPFLDKQLASTGNQVVPGDKVIDEEKFRAAIQKIFDNPKAYQKTDYSISLGVHAWQPEGELERFKELLADYAGRDEFWYCNQTEFAAYRLQAKQTRIEPVDSSPGVYTVTRPAASVAGNESPLTLRIPGEIPSRVLLDGRELEIHPDGEQSCRVNLPYPASQALPAKIDWTDSSRTESEEFPGLRFVLSPAADRGWRLVLENNSASSLSNVRITLRLPLQYRDGMRHEFLAEIPAGQSDVRTLAPGELEETWRHTDGLLFAAAEIDFMQDGRAGRIYATCLEERPVQPVLAVRDAAVFTGPLDPEAVDWPQLIAFSVPGADLVPLSDSPLHQWTAATEEMRMLFARDHFVPFVQEGAWIYESKQFKKKPGFAVAVLDLVFPEAGPLDIQSELPLVRLGLDGNDVPVDAIARTSPPAGRHRVLLVLNTNGKLPFYRALPVPLAMSVNGSPVTYVLPALNVNDEQPDG